MMASDDHSLILRNKLNPQRIDDALASQGHLAIGDPK